MIVVLFCAKVDGDISSDWMILYIPFWIMNMFLLLNIYVLITAKVLKKKSIL